MPKKHHERAEHGEHAENSAEKKDGKPCCSTMGQGAVVFVIVSLIVGLVAGAAVGYFIPKPGAAPAPPGQPTAAVGVEEITAKVAAYLNTNFLSVQGTTARVSNVGQYNDFLYSAKLEVMKDGAPVEGQDQNIFITKDGKTLIAGEEYKNAVIMGQLFFMDVPFPAQETPETPPAAAMPKSDKPEVELFVWAFCPGGVSGESTLKPVVDLLGNKIDTKVVFIGPVSTDKTSAAYGCFAGRNSDGTPKPLEEALSNCCVTYPNIDGQAVYSCALHNKAGNLDESHESGRQACIQKNYPEKYWAYLDAFNNACWGKTGIDACWKAEAGKLGIDTQKIGQCAEGAEGINMLIGDSGKSDQYQVSSSPSLFINGVEFTGSRTPEAYKEAVCSAFNTPPAECGSAIGAAAAPDTSNATCG